MPKAEVGSTKHIANKLKAKGLQRLRWYCQICQKQCRDENGFKQHTQSEGHVRAMLLVGEDPKKYIEDYSRQFQRDFLQLLKTGHGEKKVHMNQFYQEYIKDKEHIHMNATKWPSLTEFAKHLGREGICRVEEGERGLEIMWVDDSAEAIRRREDVRRKERLAKGDEEVEARLLERQIRLAREEAERAGRGANERVLVRGDEGGEAEVGEPVKVSLSLGGRVPVKQKQGVLKETTEEDVPVESITEFSSAAPTTTLQNGDRDVPPANDVPHTNDEQKEELQDQPPPKPSTSISLAAANKPKPANPLMAKKNPFSKKKDVSTPEPEKKMSNAERIMREEMEAKRKVQERMEGRKRQRVD